MIPKTNILLISIKLLCTQHTIANDLHSTDFPIKTVQAFAQGITWYDNDVSGLLSETICYTLACERFLYASR